MVSRPLSATSARCLLLSSFTGLPAAPGTSIEDSRHAKKPFLPLLSGEAVACLSRTIRFLFLMALGRLKDDIALAPGSVFDESRDLEGDNSLSLSSNKAPTSVSIITPRNRRIKFFVFLPNLTNTLTADVPSVFIALADRFSRPSLAISSSYPSTHTSQKSPSSEPNATVSIFPALQVDETTLSGCRASFFRKVSISKGRNPEVLLITPSMTNVRFMPG
mmetsp:Transcript_14455/g.34610  ORF Transcript_14455/g.34610 Transcript_14455/m.34610 type:complete len:219 (-) Transcript_14455:1189-1845(-)